jgi:hypothetical protein
VDLIDLIIEPRRTISITVIVLSVALGAVAIIIHPNTVTILGVGILVLSIVSAIVALRLRKWPGAIAAIVTLIVFVGGVYVSLFLGKK